MTGRVHECFVHTAVFTVRDYGSTSYETILPVRLETSGDVLSTVDMVVQRRDGPRWLRKLDDDDDDDDDDHGRHVQPVLVLRPFSSSQRRDRRPQHQHSCRARFRQVSSAFVPLDHEATGF